DGEQHERNNVVEEPVPDSTGVELALRQCRKRHRGHRLLPSAWSVVPVRMVRTARGGPALPVFGQHHGVTTCGGQRPAGAQLFHRYRPPWVTVAGGIATARPSSIFVVPTSRINPGDPVFPVCGWP